MKYTTFVSKLHEIAQLFRDCGKEKDEDEKFELSFYKLKHQDLVIQKASSNTLYRCDGNMNFVDVSNLFAFDGQDLKPTLQMKRGIEVINLAAGSANKGYAPSSGIFLSNGFIFTGKYLSPTFGALSYDEKRKLGETRDGETGSNAKNNQKVANMNLQNMEKAKMLNKKLKYLQRKVATLEAGKASAEEGVAEKDNVNDYSSSWCWAANGRTSQ